MRLPLLAKMLMVLLLATLAPLSIFGALSIHRGLDAIGRTAEQNLPLVASVAAARLDQLFADKRQFPIIRLLPAGRSPHCFRRWP